MKTETFIGLIRRPLAEKWGYIWGTAGQVWTASAQRAATREATVRYGARWIGSRVTDCSGLLAWAAKEGGESLPHGSNSIWRSSLVACGPIRKDTVLLPGMAVFKKKLGGGYDHVGVWDGEKVIEAKGTRYGVVASTLSGWTHWGQLAILDSGEPGEETDWRVCSNGLNLREKPGKSARRLALLPRDTQVTVRKRKGEWCEAECLLRGWVMQRYLKSEQ